MVAPDKNVVEAAAVDANLGGNLALGAALVQSRHGSEVLFGNARGVSREMTSRSE